MQFKDEARRISDDAHLPPLDAHDLLARGRRRVRRRRVAVASASVFTVAALGMGAWAVGHNVLDRRSPIPATPAPVPSPTLRAAGDGCVVEALPVEWERLLQDTTTSIDGRGRERVVHIADDGGTVVESHTADGEVTALHWFPTTEISADGGTLLHELDRSSGGGINGIDRDGDRYVFNVSTADGTGTVLGWSMATNTVDELFTVHDVFRPVALHDGRVAYLERDALKLRNLDGTGEQLLADGIADFVRDGDRLVATTEDGGIVVIDLDTLEQEPAPGPVESAHADGATAHGGTWAWADEQTSTFGAWSGRWDGALTVDMAAERSYSAPVPQVAAELVTLKDHVSDDVTVGSIWDLRTNAVVTLPDGFVAEAHGDHLVTYRTQDHRMDLIAIVPADDLDQLSCD